jgi:outer membrane protein OmpA-like peptidoglycan-associated protein
MKAHHVLFPILLIVGIGECVALNMVAGRAGPAGAAECPEAPPCPAASPADTSPPAEGAASATASAQPSPPASASAPDAEGAEQTSAGSAAPPPGAVQLPFAPQSALFEPNARSEMFKIARAMKDDPAKKIKLIGHSDLVSDGDRAESLPERRARSCHDFIVQLGIENDRVSYEARPPSQSTTAAESGQHRAVTAIWQ